MHTPSPSHTPTSPRPARPRRRPKALFVWVLWLAGPATSVAQTTWSVPGDFPTLQAALAGVGPGDTISVAPGTYPAVGLLFPAFDVVLRSEAGPESTWLDGQNLGRILTVPNGVGPGARIEGFTFLGGAAAAPGGGALWLMGGASPTVERCIFRSNRCLPRATAGNGAPGSNAGGSGATGGAGGPGAVGLAGYPGGAVYVEAGSPVFRACLFYDNRAGDGGRGGNGGTGGKGGPGPAFGSGGKGGTGGLGGTGGAGGRGGAIATQAGVVTLLQCAFRANAAGRGGAGGNGGLGGPGGDAGFLGSPGAQGAGGMGGSGGPGGLGGGLAALGSGAGFQVVNGDVFAQPTSLGGPGGGPGAGVPSGNSGPVGPGGQGSAAHGWIGSALDFQNTLLEANGGAASAVAWSQGPSATFSHSLADFALPPGPGNLPGPSLFASPSPHPWSLRAPGANSPTIDQGDGSALPSSVALDAKGQKRRVDDPSAADGLLAGTPPLDLGPVEFQPPATFALLPCPFHPPGTLVQLGGAPSLGGSLDLALGNPLGTQGPALVFALVSFGGFASPQQPCGLPVNGLGMDGPVGWLAVDLAPGASLAPLSAGLLLEPGLVPWSLTVPNLPQLAGLQLHLQGAVVEIAPGAYPIALTGAAIAVIGS